MIILIDAEKLFEKKSTSIHMTNFQQTGNRGKLLQSDKEHVNKSPPANIVINNGTLDAFPPEDWE